MRKANSIEDRNQQNYQEVVLPGIVVDIDTDNQYLTMLVAVREEVEEEGKLSNSVLVDTVAERIERKVELVIDNIELQIDLIVDNMMNQKRKDSKRFD